MIHWTTNQMVRNKVMQVERGLHNCHQRRISLRVGKGIGITEHMALPLLEVGIKVAV